MGRTLAEALIASRTEDPVAPGSICRVRVDFAFANDITAPLAIKSFRLMGAKKVFDRAKVALVMDHFTPNKDIKAAEQCLQCRTFAHRFDIDNFYDVGQMGVEHALLPEKGLVAAGDCIIGADSHTCTYGALGGFATGVGSTDLGAAMATGTCWFKVPEAIKVIITGKKPADITGKDVMLTLIGMIGVDGALYQSLEFTGDGIAELSMTDRFTMANMAIEAGAKNGIFPVDEKTKAYLKGRVDRDWQGVEADADANYVREIKIELDKIKNITKSVCTQNTRRTAAEIYGRNISFGFFRPVIGFFFVSVHA